MSYYLAMVGTRDSPVYEAELGTHRQGHDGTPRFSAEMKELNPFVVHAAIDVVEDLQWKANSQYLKVVDEFNGYLVSGFVTAGNIKFLLVHETKNEESIRQFFTELNDLYVKTLLNPFYKVNDPITSPVFDMKVRLFAKKYL
jgi:hypothetical protein